MRLTELNCLAATAACVFLSAAAAAQTSAPPTPPPCSGDEFRQLDFWVGNWHAEWDNGDGTIGTGENRITRGEFGDCVIYERFAAGSFIGMSVSTYHTPVGAWRQTWVDNNGGYFALVGGPGGDYDAYDFMVENTRLSDSAPHLRMIWENVTEDSFTWRWQQRADESSEWSDSWVIRYSRLEE